MPSLSELWKSSGIFYHELAFKSLMDMRRANFSERAIRKVLDNSLVSMTINKIFLTLIFLIAAIFAGVQHTPLSYASFLLLVTFMFALFFLQSVTYFFQVNFDILSTLPLTLKNKNKIMVLTFLRIFDIPLLANILIFPIVVGFSSGPIAAVPALVGIIMAEIFAVAIVTYFSRIFYRKLASPSSGWKAAVRFIFIIIWGSAFFILYAVMIWMPIIYEKIEKFEPLINTYGLLLKLIFPFNIAYLITNLDIVALLSTLLFIFLAYLSWNWLKHAIGEKINVEVQEIGEIKLKSSSPLHAMLRKDFKVTTRNPGLAMLLLLPAMEGLLLISIHVNIVALMSSIITFIVIFLYSVFGFEKRELIKTLPVTRGFLYVSKNILAFAVFIATMFALNLFSLFTGYFIPLSYQILLSIGIFSAGIFILYIGDALGLRTSVAMNALGFLLLVVVGNVVALLPIIILLAIPNVMGLAFSTGAAIVLFLLSLFVIKSAS